MPVHVGKLNLVVDHRIYFLHVADHAEVVGKCTPRGFQGYSADAMLTLLRLCIVVLECIVTEMPGEAPLSERGAGVSKLLFCPLYCN